MRIPEHIEALLLDMDGVVTNTAVLHAKAWKEAFDDALARLDGDHDPFDARADYAAHVDGRPRLDGVRGFLSSRGIELPGGDEGDGPDALTVHGVGRAKNDRLVALIASEGVEAYEGSVRLLHAARAAGLRTALVSSSANARAAIDAAGLEDCFDAWVDGVRIDEEGLAGKPAPDTFLLAARELGVEPSRAAVVEDALSGVEAGRAGSFGWVLGVDRLDHADALREHGADAVVADLDEIEGP